MRKIYIAILTILLIIALITSCIYLGVNNSNGNDSHYPITSYIVEVIATNQDNYTILIPFPSANGQIFNEVYENLTISSGYASYSISNSSKGFESFGLNVTFTNSFKLRWESKMDLFYYLSMENRTNRIDESWYNENPEWIIFLDSPSNNNITINVRYEIDFGTMMEAYSINGEIVNGWNILSGKKILRED